MSAALKMYRHMPIFVQNIACSIEGWRIQRSRYGTSFNDSLANFTARDRVSNTGIIAYRDAAFSRTLKDAVKNVPYYQDLAIYSEVAASDAPISNLIGQLPILTKADVQGDPALFSNPSYSADDLQTVHTSGTTGAGLIFSLLPKAASDQWAVWWRYRSAHGIAQNTWCGYFGGRSVVSPMQQTPPFWRINYPGRQIMFSAYHTKPENLDMYIDELSKNKIPWLHGYPSILSLVAERAIATKKEPLDHVQWVTTGAENLNLHQSNQIERAFGVKPIQHYGLAEGVANISECPRGRLHVDEDFSFVELLPLSDGNDHKLVGTAFSNAAFPLIRYDTGDIVQYYPEDSCDCGRPGRIIRSIDGRSEDYLTLVDGAKIGRLDHIFKDMTNIKECQFIQDNLETVTLRIVKGAFYTDADEIRLSAEIEKRIGDRIEIIYDYVDRIPRTTTGKLRFVVSKL